MSTKQKAILSIVCTDDDLPTFGRRLACAVNDSCMHLMGVYELATQVYPIRTDSVRGVATITRCEFKMRNTGQSISEYALADLMSRLRAYEVLDHKLVGEAVPAWGDILPVAS
jgi:hypothetical protein